MGNTGNICKQVCEQCDAIDTTVSHPLPPREKIQILNPHQKVTTSKSNLKETDARQKMPETNAKNQGNSPKVQVKHAPKKNRGEKDDKDRRLIDEWVKSIYDDILSYECKRVSPRSAANIRPKEAVLKQKIKEKISVLDLPETEPITLKINVPSQFRESLIERWSSEEYDPSRLFLSINYEQLFSSQ